MNRKIVVIILLIMFSVIVVSGIIKDKTSLNTGGTATTLTAGNTETLTENTTGTLTTNSKVDKKVVFRADGFAGVLIFMKVQYSIKMNGSGEIHVVRRKAIDDYKQKVNNSWHTEDGILTFLENEQKKGIVKNLNPLLLTDTVIADVNKDVLNELSNRSDIRSIEWGDMPVYADG